MRLGLAYVPEDRRQHGVIGAMSVAANTALASLGRLGALSRFGLLDRAAERAEAQRFVTDFAIRTPSIDAPVGTLSGGNQQKVALARWLATKPRLLILDEPTQGVDIGAKAEIHRLIRALAADGLAILLISSELTELLGLRRPHRRDARRPAGRRARSRRRHRGAADVAGPRPHAAGVGAAHGRRGATGRRGPAGVNRPLWVALAWAALLALVAAVAPAFFDPVNLRDLVVRASPLLIVACGMTIVILARQIDISVGSQFAICGVVAGLLARDGLADAARRARHDGRRRRPRR